MSALIKIKEVCLDKDIPKKVVKKILVDLGVITKSWAIKDSKGLVMELRVNRGTHVETTPLLTEAGVILITEIAVARNRESMIVEEEEVTHG